PTDGLLARCHSCLCPRSNPQGGADQSADPHAPRDDAFGGRSEATQRVTTRLVVAVADRLHVGDDVLLLLRSQLPVRELRHVLRAGLHRGVNLVLARRGEFGRVLARRERTALAGEVVTGRAVEAEQLATTSRVVPLERLARLVRRSEEHTSELQSRANH